MTGRLALKDTREGVCFLVRVSARASRTSVAGLLGEGPQAALKIALQAPPVEGRANEALVHFLAELFDLPRSAVEITSGKRARTKVVLVRGRTAEQVGLILDRAIARS